MTRRYRMDDSGTIVPMIVGFMLVVTLLFFVVIGSTVVFLAHRAIGTYADGAALAAAQEIDKSALYLHGGGIVDNSLLPVGATAQGAATRYLVDAKADEKFPGITAAATVDSGQTATDQVHVKVAADVHIPFASMFGLTSTLTVGYTATAVLRCGQGAANTTCTAG